MEHCINDPLHGLDELLSAEAAQLTDDERLLVSDMVQQLVGGGDSTARHLLSTPAGSNLAAQLEQLLPGVLHTAQQPQQHNLTTAALAAQNLQYQGQPEHFPAGVHASAAARSAGPAGFRDFMHPSTQLNMTPLPAQVMEVAGLHSPSSSGRSSPVSPQSRHVSRAMSPQHPLLRASAQQPAQTAPPAPAPAHDVAAEAAADMLTEALTDPHASIDDIVSIFDRVLTAGENSARELQQRLSSPPQHPQQQQPVQSQAQHPFQMQQQQAQWLAAAQQQQQMPSYHQPQPASLMQPPAVAPGKQSLLNAYLQEQHNPQHPLLSSARPAGSPSAAQTSPTQQGSMQSPAAWQPGRPGTAPAGSSSNPAGPAPAPAHPQHSSSHANPAVPHYAALAAAAAARRSQSPDVFKRLSAKSTLAAASKAACGPAGLRSESPTEIERNWLGMLRGSGGADSPSSPPRHHSGGRSRSGSPPERQQQQGGEAVPWLTAASVQSARHTSAPAGGPLEWDADTRSIKWAGASRNSRSPARTTSGEERSSSSAFVQKQQVKLPAHVVEERMRQFYERNVDWKRRCAMVYERQREQLKQGETEGCTFAPAINRKSDKMAQELRSSYPMKSIRPLTPLASAAGDLEQQLRKQQLLQQQRRSASTGRMRQKQQHASWLYGSMGSSCMSPRSGGPSSGGGSDQSVPPAVQRLFQDAAVRMQRAEKYKEATAVAERQARSWSAPRCPAAEGVPARVYDHLDPERSSRRHHHKHADPEECTHKPWTNPRPKSAGPAAAAKPPADDEQEVVEEFVALLDDSSAAEQQQPARPGSAATAAGAACSPSQQQQRSASAQRIGSATRNADLDWEEFIERQSRHIGRVEQRVARVAAREQELRLEASPELSPGTRRILARKQALCINAGEGSPPGKATGSDSNQASPKHPDFLHRLQQESDTHASSGGGSSMGAPATTLAGARQPARTTGGGSSGGGSACDECTFRPRITPKAAAKKARSVTEMSEGDRLRREVRLEQMRVMSEAKQLAGATFRPDLSPSRQREGECFASVPAKLNLSSDGLSAYMASLQEKRRQLEERRKKAESKRQEEELRECTFKPETTPVPAYITEMAEVGYTARYIDRVMQGALADGRVGPTAAAAVKEKMSPGGKAPQMEGSPPDMPYMINTKY